MFHNMLIIIGDTAGLDGVHLVKQLTRCEMTRGFKKN